MEETYKENRKWGSFDQFTLNESVTVKLLNVDENGATSLQTHKQRNEFWRIISGTPVITIADQTFTAKVGDEFKIPAETKHKVSSPTGKTIILEISRGHFDENDIIRY